jgi:hypothetical protein
MPTVAITKIVSVGQTGTDRGGLDAAIEAGVAHGGWCPRGRKAEDGVIPGQYRLVEMETDDYLARTEANVVDSDCTVVFTYGKPTGGSTKTVAFAAKHRRPCLCVNLEAISELWAAEAIRQWLVPTSDLFRDEMTPPPNPVVNVAGYYLLVFMRIAPRQISIAGITLAPEGEWMKQMARNMTMTGDGFLNGCRHLLHDRDTKFSAAFCEILRSSGIQPLALPPRSPNLNSHLET